MRTGLSTLAQLLVRESLPRLAQSLSRFVRDEFAAMCGANFLARLGAAFMTDQASPDLRSMFWRQRPPAFRRGHLRDRFWRQTALIARDQIACVIQALMLCFRCAQAQVLKAIIGLDFVDVMQGGTWWNRAIGGFPYHAMLGRPAPLSFNGFDADVTLSVDPFRTNRQRIMGWHLL